MIKTEGLKGVYNRINMFSSIIKEDVIDVTAFIPQSSYPVSNRTMLISRTEKLINTGRDLSISEFIQILKLNTGNFSTKEQIESRKLHTNPDFNVSSNNIGKDYRKIANTVMLLARANHFINTKYDLMPYEFIETLKTNSGQMVENIK